MVADDDKENDVLIYEEEAPLGDNNILQSINVNEV